MPIDRIQRDEATPVGEPFYATQSTARAGDSRALGRVAGLQSHPIQDITYGQSLPSVHLNQLSFLDAASHIIFKLTQLPSQTPGNVPKCIGYRTQCTAI